MSETWFEKRKGIKMAKQRLAPSKMTVRDVALKSGNLCAFPNCNEKIMDENSNFVGQLCHIEAAEPGGERYRASMTDEERRHANNLMFMCYRHHVITDDVAKYPTPDMQKMKQNHEKRFAGTNPHMSQLLRDWTQSSEPTFPLNLKKMNRICGWHQRDDELEYSVEELSEYIEKLRHIPIEVRHFLCVVAKRFYLMRNTRAVRYDGSMTILTSDLERALRLSGQQVADLGRSLDAYGIGDLRSSTMTQYDDVEQWTIVIYRFKSDWLFWFDAVVFCEVEGIPLEALAEDLDFSVLDE